MKTTIALGLAAASALGISPAIGFLRVPLVSASSYSPPAECVQWYDGCNMCVRTANGTTCTDRSCQASGKGFCVEEEATSTQQS